MTYSSDAGLMIGDSDAYMTYTTKNGLVIKGSITATILSVGDSSKNSYMKYDSDNGLVVQGDITANALTVGDPSKDNYMTYDSDHGL